MLTGRIIPKVLQQLLLVALATASAEAQEKPAAHTGISFKVARFSANQVQQEIGYENVGLLTASAEVRAKLAEIQKERSQLSSKILSIKSDGDMEKLQVELRILENKKNLLTQALGTLQNSDLSKTISDYVKKYWGEKYGLIYNADNGSTWQGYGVIYANYTEDDLTGAIGEKIKKELLLGEGSGNP